jgi:hypothetical protein
MSNIEAGEAPIALACFHGSGDPKHWQKRA